MRGPPLLSERLREAKFRACAGGRGVLTSSIEQRSTGGGFDGETRFPR